MPYPAYICLNTRHATRYPIFPFSGHDFASASCPLEAFAKRVKAVPALLVFRVQVMCADIGMLDNVNRSQGRQPVFVR